jgi:DNA-binding IclR family transcriptional regulator
VRALSLLRAVGSADGECGLSKLATDHGLHKTTALRLLGALEREGFVARDGSAGPYRLGPTLIALGTQARGSVDLRVVAHPVLVALAAECGETSTLEMLAGEEVVIVDEAHGRFLLGAKPEVGTRWPAHATSTGKVLLAAARHERASEAVPTPRGRLTRLAPNTITSRAELDRALAKVWRAGFAISESEIEEDFVAVAAPVHDSRGATIAAISAGGPSARIPRSRHAALSALVCRAAADLSRRLGAPPERQSPARVASKISHPTG